MTTLHSYWQGVLVRPRIPRQCQSGRCFFGALLNGMIVAGGILALLGGHWVTMATTLQPVDTLVPFWSRSYQLYQQPHAIWLADYERIGINLPTLKQTLEAAEIQKKRPEIVIYSIPYRDMGQSSAGGFDTYPQYYADNRLIAETIRKFVKNTGLQPRIYLEPDALGHAITYRADRQFDKTSQELYQLRITAMNWLIDLYNDAGCWVYLDAAHSDWFDYSDEQITTMAEALNASGISKAYGLVVNVSNRQPAIGGASGRNEAHYLSRLLPQLRNKRLDVVMDTSRNGGTTSPRLYYLAPANNGQSLGDLVDNELPQGRWVGHWELDKNKELWAKPLFGKPMRLSVITALDKYHYNEETRILKAPAWLDPIGDVQLGPKPTDHTGLPLIQRFRYIKPPDDCDGALNCPARVDKWARSNSKHDTLALTLNRQKERHYTDINFWKKRTTLEIKP
ncbi:MAG: glycoside hydrolase family 6 protein [Vampirovibrionales bacterium]